jgi:kynurenine formamidase
MHTPGFSAEATEFLKAESPQVRAVVFNTSSLDIGASSDFPAHASWLPSGGFAIEDPANLDRAPPVGAVLFVGAPTFESGSGGPAHVFALVS